MDLGDTNIVRFKSIHNSLLQRDKVDLDIEDKLMDAYNLLKLNRHKEHENIAVSYAYVQRDLINTL